MLRRPFTVASTLSLLLCVMTVALWAKDRHRTMRLEYESHHTVPETGYVRRDWFIFYSSAGLLRLYHGRQTVPPDNTFEESSAWFHKSSNSPTDPWEGEERSAFNRWGFGWEPRTELQNYQAHNWSVVFPDWFVAAIAFAPAAYWLYRWRRHRARRQTGLCVGCGYDLRASTDRCPECGTPISSNQPALPC